jgi:hypothetical protein
LQRWAQYNNWKYEVVVVVVQCRGHNCCVGAFNSPIVVCIVVIAKTPLEVPPYISGMNQILRSPRIHVHVIAPVSARIRTR